MSGGYPPIQSVRRKIVRKQSGITMTMQWIRWLILPRQIPHRALYVRRMDAADRTSTTTAYVGFPAATIQQTMSMTEFYTMVIMRVTDMAIITIPVTRVAVIKVAVATRAAAVVMAAADVADN